MVFPTALKRCSLAPLAAAVLAGCSSGLDVPIDGGGIAIPLAILDLPRTELLEVLVYVDDERAPRHRETDIDLSDETISLSFDAPEGERVFTLVFVYADPEIRREDGEPWELARWTSAPVRVGANVPLTLNVDTEEYVYADDDGDGVFNLVELRARTRPDDPTDVPVDGPDPDPDPDPESPPPPPPPPVDPPEEPEEPPTEPEEPEEPQEPEPPEEPEEPPEEPEEPEEPSEPEGPEEPSEPEEPEEPEEPHFEAPVGFWRGSNGRDETVLGLFHGDRLLITDPTRVYDADWEERGDGGFSAIAVQYQVNGGRAPLPVSLSGARDGDDMTLRYGFPRRERIELSLDPAYQHDSSLDLIARQWGRASGDDVLVFPVGGDGALSGASDSRGCLYEGGLDLIDTDFNLYTVQLSLSENSPDGCRGLAGSGYSGLASLVDENRLLIVATDGAHALRMVLEPGAEAPPDPDLDPGDEGDRDDEDEGDEDDEPDEDADDGGRRGFR